MTTKPEFKNIKNKVYHTKEGHTKWDSRACAVVAHVWFIKHGIPYVLIGKRGQVMDCPGKWNIPCGYLDWNENLQQAFFREVWEETGLDLAPYLKSQKVIYDKSTEPWFVYSEPSENRQNVAMHMSLIVDLSADPLPELSLDNMEENESTGAYWKSIYEILEMTDDEWAFSHLKRLKLFKTKVDYLIKLYETRTV